MAEGTASKSRQGTWYEISSRIIKPAWVGIRNFTLSIFVWISRIIDEHYVWRFAQKTLLAGF